MKVYIEGEAITCDEFLEVFREQEKDKVRKIRSRERKGKKNQRAALLQVQKPPVVKVIIVDTASLLVPLDFISFTVDENV